MNKPLFITFEGGEGVGKSTLMSSLYECLLERQLLVVKTREPGGTTLGEHVRNLLLHQKHTEISEVAEMLLFLTSRVQQIKETIAPHLEKNYIVLCDRYNDSTIAYQGIARGVGQKYAEELCNLACQNLKPDLTFFLDLDPKVGLQRIGARDEQWDRLENLELAFHEKVRQAYLKLAKESDHRIIVVDAMQSPEDVFKQCIFEIQKKLG